MERFWKFPLIYLVKYEEIKSGKLCIISSFKRQKSLLFFNLILFLCQKYFSSGFKNNFFSVKYTYSGKWCPSLSTPKYTIIPRITPNTISTHDSGKCLYNMGIS